MNESSIDLLILIFPIAALQGIFLSFLLFINKKGNNKANRILSILLFSLSLIIIEYFLSIYGLFKIFPHAIYISSPFWFVIGPLTFLYVIKVTNSDSKFSKIHLVHFIPATIALSMLIEFYILPADIKFNYYVSSTADGGSTLFHSLWNYSYALLTLVYTILSYLKIKNYKESYTNQYSGIHYSHIRWLNIIFTIYIAYIIIDFVLPHVFLFTHNKDALNIYASVSIFCISTISYIIGYFAINQPDSMFPTISKLQVEESNTEKYQTSGLSKELMKEIIEKLNSCYANK